MPDEIEYLVKYSVAPAPSRDYYGIRILPNEIQLFVWKISHGPHKTPIVRIAKFADFNEDKPLQEDILRVFGKNVLDYARERTLGKTKNSEDNPCGLARGWFRVFKEGQAMQEASNGAGQVEKKRNVRTKCPSIGAKANIPTKSRVKVLAKFPLEVIKRIPGSSKNLVKPPERNTNVLSSPLNRQMTEVSEKTLRMKVTAEFVEKSKTTREANPTILKIHETNEKKSKTITPSKSTILNTDKALMTGLSTVTNKNVNLSDLIHEKAKKIGHERSFYDSYHSCIEDVEKLVGDTKKLKESSSGNYDIENPWSSNSSIISVPSPKETTASTVFKAGKLDVKEKRKTARELLMTKRTSNFGRKVEQTTEHVQSGVLHKFPLTRSSATRIFSKTAGTATSKSKMDIGGSRKK